MTEKRPLRLVAITSGHAYGVRLLRRFTLAGVPFAALFVTLQQNTPRHPTRGSSRGWVRRSRDIARGYLRAWRRWPRLATRIRVVESLADARLMRWLVRARPDLLILGGTGIVPPHILRIPTVATLNAHPGLLPWVRGVCPLEHALLRGVALGVTVHAVDEGIDTGPIVRRVLVRPSEGAEDRITLQRRVEDAAIDTFADVVVAMRRGESPALRPQASRHPYGHWVSDDQRARATSLLTAGEAHRLYERWRTAAGGDVLPDDDALLPGPLR